MACYAAKQPNAAVNEELSSMSKKTLLLIT